MFLKENNGLKKIGLNGSSCNAITEKNIFLGPCVPFERFSIECRKTKTKVISLANHNRRKQHNQPIRTRTKYM